MCFLPPMGLIHRYATKNELKIQRLFTTFALFMLLVVIEILVTPPIRLKRDACLSRLCLPIAICGLQSEYNDRSHFSGCRST